MASLYLVRHGQAAFGTENYDRLSSTGIRQAQLAGRYLQRISGDSARIVCGTLVRQRDTAAHIAESIARARGSTFPVHSDERLNELDTDLQVRRFAPGLPDGSAAEQVDLAQSSARSYQKILRHSFLHWQSLTETSPELETWTAFSARVAAALRGLLQQSVPGESTIAVTSGGVIATVTQQVLGLPHAAAYEFFEVMMNCSITRFLHDRVRISLSSFNECSYLAADEHGEASPQLLTYR
jgi:broad specificity phosphatase PhoE